MSASHEPESPPTFRVLLALAWPVIISRATQSVVGFSDALMVAPLGESALAAATTGALDTFTLILFPMGLVFIVQSFVAQLRGRGELDAVRRYVRYGLVVAVVAELFALAAIPLVPGFVARLGYDPEVARGLSDYLAIRLVAVGAAVGTEAIGNWYGGLGSTRIPMLASVVTMVSNIALNYALIEPRFGLPGYGVAGAAVASAIATCLGLVFILAMYLRGFGFELPAGDTRMRAREFGRVLRFGSPNGFNWLLEFAAFAVFINVVVGGLGTTALAALNVVIQVNSVAFMPTFGLASAGAILVGEAIGRKRHDHVPVVVRMTALTGGIWMSLAGALYLAIPEAILSLFATSAEESAALVAVGATMLAMSVGWQLFDAVGITLGEALRAAGDTAYCMVARLFIAWVFFVPLAFVLVDVLDLGARGAMLAIIAYLAALALALALRFASGRWRSIELVPDVPI